MASIVALVLCLAFFLPGNLKAEQADTAPAYPVQLRMFLLEHSEYHVVTASDIDDGEEKADFLNGGKGGGFKFSSYRVMDRSLNVEVQQASGPMIDLQWCFEAMN